MKKIGLSTLIAGLLVANVTVADTVAVKDGLVFLAGNDELTVQPVVPSEKLSGACSNILPMSIPNATDVAISHGYAFVTTKVVNPSNKVVVDVIPVDVSSCLASSNSCDIEPTVNLDRGELYIPCLEVNGKVHAINMRQRGNSMNWEVTGIEDSVHHHEHDDD